MRIHSTKTIPTMALTAALALGLSACGGSSDSSTSPSSTTDSSASATSAAASATSAAAGGSFSATIDGQPFTIEKATVSCQAENGTKTVYAASTTTGPTSTFTVTLDDSGTVTTVMAAESGKKALNFMDTAGIGHAEATVDGSTYTIKGEAPAETPTDASAPLKTFEATVTCSS